MPEQAKRCRLNSSHGCGGARLARDVSHSSAAQMANTSSSQRRTAVMLLPGPDPAPIAYERRNGPLSLLVR